MTPNPNPSPELREAIAAAKIKARDVLGIAWHNLEEISRFELVLANLTPPPRHDSDCGLLYDDGPEECTCEPDPLRKAAKAITCKLEESEASFARNVASLPGEPPIGDDDGVCISVGDLRALRAALSPQTLPAPGEVDRIVVSECSYCGLVTTANLPDIEAEGERVVADTWKHSSGMYLWTDMLGAIQTAIADERARHTTLATVAAANDEGVALLIAQAEFLCDRLDELDWSQDFDGVCRDYSGHVDPALSRLKSTIRLLSQGGGK